MRWTHSRSSTAAALVAGLLACGGAGDDAARSSEAEWSSAGTTSSATYCNACHGTPPSTGEHREHNFSCDRCHAGFTATTTNWMYHRNGKIDVTLTAWSPATRTCGRACHGSESWGAKAPPIASCDACHDFPMHAESTCSNCHSKTIDASFRLISGGPHRNGVADVDAAACLGCHGVPPASHAPTATACALCHPTAVDAQGRLLAGGAHGARWAAQTLGPDGGCGTCHGYPPPAPHLFDGRCYACHPTTMAPGNVLIPDGTHEDGTVEAVLDCGMCHGNPPSTHSAGTAACATCHPTTIGANGELVPGGTHLDGKVEAALGPATCGMCHGYPPATHGAAATACSTCHPTTGGTSSVLVAGGTHLDGVVNVLTNSTVCGQCHGFPPRSGEHGEHGRFACSQCHPTSGPTHMNGIRDVSLPAWQPATRSCGRACHGSERW